jgi:DNA polymerase III gamma/tau subunit
MNFGKLALNEEIEKKLSAAVDSGTLSHAVLLTGGTEKERKELSILLAQAVFCSNEPKPCLKCDICKKVKAGNHPDIFIVSGEAGKQRSIKIDTIRDIRARAHIMPNEAPFQIFIIL